MVLFSQRMKITRLFAEWCKENGVTTSCVNFLVFLQGKGWLNEETIKRDISTVGEVYDTFSLFKKHALEVIVHRAMGINDVSEEDVISAAKLISEMKEPDKTVAFFIIGEALKEKGANI